MRHHILFFDEILNPPLRRDRFRQRASLLYNLILLFRKFSVKGLLGIGATRGYSLLDFVLEFSLYCGHIPLIRPASYIPCFVEKPGTFF